MYGRTFNNPKNLREKCVTLMNKNSEIYGVCWNKTTFHQFLLSTDDTVLWLKGLDRTTYFQTLEFKTLAVVLVMEFFYRSYKIEKVSSQN